MILAQTLKGKGSRSRKGRAAGTARRSRRARSSTRCSRRSKRSSCPRTSQRSLPTDRARARSEQARGAEQRHGRRRRLQAAATAWPRARRTARRSPSSGDGDDRIVALDADVKNSTFSEKFEEQHPDRFFQNFIAEQVMIGAAMGLAAAAPFRSRRRSPRSSRAPTTSSAWRHQQPQHQDGRLARRRVDWRGRPVADGARRPRDDARAAEHHGALPVRRGEHRAAARADGLPSRARVHADVAAEDAGDLRARRTFAHRRAEDAARERHRRGDGRSAPASRCSRR